MKLRWWSISEIEEIGCILAFLGDSEPAWLFLFGIDGGTDGSHWSSPAGWEADNVLLPQIMTPGLIEDNVEARYLHVYTTALIRFNPIDSDWLFFIRTDDRL